MLPYLLGKTLSSRVKNYIKTCEDAAGAETYYNYSKTGRNLIDEIASDGEQT